MLDHVFVRAIGAMRDALDNALLQRVKNTEEYLLDLVSGETTWEVDYTLPGEEAKPRVYARITFDWSAWSQSAWWNDDEDNRDDDDPPDIDITVMFRVQRLVDPPDVAGAGAALPDDGPVCVPYSLQRQPPSIQQRFYEPGTPPDFSFAVQFEGFYDLRSDSKPQDDLAPMGGWIASTLVRMADLPLTFAPAQD